MHRRTGTRTFFLITLPFIILCYSLPLVAPSHATLGGVPGEELALVCPDYVRGTQMIDVISDIPLISTYVASVDGDPVDLVPNGASIEEVMKTVQASYFWVSRGSLTSGNASSLNADDAEDLVITSRHNQLTLYVEFSVNGLEPLPAMNYTIVGAASRAVNVVVSVLDGNHYIVRETQNSVLSIEVDESIGSVLPISTTCIYRFKIQATSSASFSFSLNKFILKYMQAAMPGLRVIDTLSIDTTLFDDGVHELKVDVGTPAGTVSATKIIVIDNMVPEFSEIFVTPELPVDNAPATIEASAVDANLDKILGQYELYNQTIELTGTGQSFSFTSNFPNGTTQFVLRAYDLAGNVRSVMEELNVTHAVDVVHEVVPGPSIEIVTRSNVTVGDVASVDVAMTGIEVLEMQVNGTLNETWVNSTSASATFTSAVPCSFLVNLAFYSNASTLHVTKQVSIRFLPIPEVITQNITIHHVPAIIVGHQGIILNGTMNFVGNISITSVNGSGPWYFFDVQVFSVVANLTAIGVHQYNVTITQGGQVEYSAIFDVTVIGKEVVYVEFATPGIEIVTRSNVTVGDVASVDVAMTGIDVLEMRVNGTLNETWVNSTSASATFTSAVPCSLLVNLAFYSNITTLYAQSTILLTFTDPGEDPRFVTLAALPVIVVNRTTAWLNGTMNFAGNVTIRDLNGTGTWILMDVSNFTFEFYPNDVGYHRFNVTIVSRGDIVFNNVIEVHVVESEPLPSHSDTWLYIIIGGMAIGLLGLGVAYTRK